MVVVMAAAGVVVVMLMHIITLMIMLMMLIMTPMPAVFLLPSPCFENQRLYIRRLHAPAHTRCLHLPMLHLRDPTPQCRQRPLRKRLNPTLALFLRVACALNHLARAPVLPRCCHVQRKEKARVCVMPGVAHHLETAAREGPLGLPSSHIVGFAREIAHLCIYTCIP